MDLMHQLSGTDQFFKTTEFDIARIRKNFRFRMVIVDCPYDTFDTKLTQNLMSQLFSMKITGYRSQYPYGALPVDTGDFYSTHLIVCEESNDGNLNPLMGFKSVLYSRCETFRENFPVFHILSGDGLDKHCHSIEKLIESAASKGEKLAYNGSWTMSTKHAEDRLVRTFLRDVTYAMLAKHYDSAEIDHCVSGATIRFGVPQMKAFLGFSRMNLDGEELPSFGVKGFFEEEVYLMHMNRPSLDSLLWAKRFDPFWDNRLVIDKGSVGAKECQSAA